MQTAMPELKDIHLPEPVSVWPPAPGWWLLGLLIVVVAAVILWFFVRWYRHRQARRQARALLARIDWQDNTWPRQLNGLLKRAAMAYFPLDEVAGLHSAQWREFLAQGIATKERQAFLQDYAQLQDQLYQPASGDLDPALYQRWAQRWLKQALPPKGGAHV